MHKVYISIILWGILLILWQKLLFADKEYLYDASADSVFIDDAFAGSIAEYKKAVESGEKIDLVSYTSTGAKIINKTINAPRIEIKHTKTSRSESKKTGYDIDKLAECVAIAETSWCTKWMGRSKNNCFGIMVRPNWKRTWKRYSSKAESFEHFKKIWNKSYWAYPNYRLAKKRTWWDNTQRRLDTVNSCYYK